MDGMELFKELIKIKNIDISKYISPAKNMIEAKANHNLRVDVATAYSTLSDKIFELEKSLEYAKINYSDKEFIDAEYNFKMKVIKTNLQYEISVSQAILTRDKEVLGRLS